MYGENERIAKVNSISIINIMSTISLNTGILLFAEYLNSTQNKDIPMVQMFYALNQLPEIALSLIFIITNTDRRVIKQISAIPRSSTIVVT
ncbi:unnamed protein product [Caenorhabditis angaria]|uniref:Uncharacterized protein n=1 Tax=Caenorhabditis angaria TaxID=860376 RepID=A0A9P1IMX0_9PELO|nr:unnamed protein product [Caenorhabditis angaria]